MAKRRIGPLIPTAEGHYTAIFDDGSTVTIDQFGTVIKQDDSPNPERAALMGSGNTEAAARTVDRASAEDARRFDAGQAQAKATLDQNYKLAMMNARTQEQQFQITSQYQAANIELAKQRLAFDERVSERDFGQRQTEFNTNTGLRQAELGQNLLSTASQLRGPSNYFQAAEYARGVASMPESSTFLSALQNNTRLADFGMQGGQPDAETIGTLAAKLTGGVGSVQGVNSQGNAVSDTSNNYLAQIGNVAAKGAHQLGAGSLENLTDTERNLFTSGLDKLGYDSNTFLNQYKRSRIGQGIGSSRAA